MTKDEKYKTLLERYVLKTQTPEWATKPLRSKNRNVATNGVVVIITPLVIPSCDEAPKKIDSAIKQIRVKQGDITIDNLKMVLFHWPKSEYTKNEEHVCAACNGKGAVDFEFHFGIETFTTNDACPVCHGLGTIYTGKPAQCLDKSHLLKIGHYLFSIDVVREIARIADVLQVETVACFQGNGKMPTLIMFDNEVSGLFYHCETSPNYFNFTPFHFAK